MANISNLGSSFAVSFSNPTLVVTTGTGANFPAAPFYVTATPAGSLSTMGTSEILLVTAKSGDTFTVTRAQKGTSTKSIAAGWIITNGIYVEDLFSTITFGEVPSGTVNGSNTVFTTAQPFTSIEVFKNGARMKGAGSDYTVTNNTTITFVTAPASGAVLLVNYIMGNQTYLVGSNSLVTDETPTGTINGTNTTFTTAQPYIGGSLQVFINGVKQKRVTHFVETTPSSGSFTINDAPIAGDDVMVCYQYVLSTTANADTVDGYHANATPTANQIPVLDINGNLPGNSWSTYTPVFTNLTVGNGTLVARWTQIGKIVFVRISLVLGSSSAVATDVSVSLPVTAASVPGTGNIPPIGQMQAFNGSAIYQGFVGWSSTNLAIVRYSSTSSGNVTAGVITSTTPFTWASGHQLAMQFSYEAA